MDELRSFLIIRPFWTLEKKFSFSSELNLMIDSSHDKDFFFLWPNNATEELPKMLDNLLICNGITVVEKNKNSLRTFGFATDQFHCNFANFFINNLDILKQIKRQFLKEQNNGDYFDKKTFFTTPISPSHKNVSEIDKVHFDNFIKINDQIIPISDEKALILQLISEGLSSKGIASTLTGKNC